MKQHFSELEVAVLKTLSYSDVFECPLSFSQLYLRLLNHQKVSENILKQSVSSLVAARIIEIVYTNRSGEVWITLKGRGKLWDIRRSRETISREKTKKARSVTNYIKMIPWVEAVYVTGSVAVENSQDDDDIDLLIIATNNRLWISRLLLNLGLDLVGLRRKPERKWRVSYESANYKDKLCLNMFMSVEKMTIGLNHQNLYTAYEVLQAKEIFTRNETALLIKNNTWIENHLPHTPLPTGPISASMQTTKKKKSSFLASKFLDKLDKMAYNSQIWHMKKRKTREIVSRNAAFFHPRDTSTIIMRKYQSRLELFGIKA